MRSLTVRGASFKPLRLPRATSRLEPLPLEAHLLRAAPFLPHLPTHTSHCTGDACKKNAECANKKCGRINANGDLKCCPSNKFVPWHSCATCGPRDYCTDVNIPNGQACTIDAQCVSKYCKGSTIGNGICGTKKKGWFGYRLVAAKRAKLSAAAATA